jgi:hypothetical protein
MAMAAIGSVSAAAATEGVETDSITDVSFSKQVEGAMHLIHKIDEGEKEEKEEKAPATKGSDKSDTIEKENKGDKPIDFKSNGKHGSLSGSGSKSRSHKYADNEIFERGFEEGICDPDDTAKENEALCEDIWEALCNPDDVAPAADNLCDWLGFTADIVWYEGDDLDYEMEYIRMESQEKAKEDSSSGGGEVSAHDRVVEGMCDPDRPKHRHEDVCNEVWESLCNPDNELDVDDDFCDWLGFTADVDWVFPVYDYVDYVKDSEYEAYNGDYPTPGYFDDESNSHDSESYNWDYPEPDNFEDESDSYDSEDMPRKNLRG